MVPGREQSLGAGGRDQRTFPLPDYVHAGGLRVAARLPPVAVLRVKREHLMANRESPNDPLLALRRLGQGGVSRRRVVGGLAGLSIGPLLGRETLASGNAPSTAFFSPPRQTSATGAVVAQGVDPNSLDPNYA